MFLYSWLQALTWKWKEYVKRFMKKKSLHSSSTFHLSTSKQFTPRKNDAILALPNPRGICSMQWSGDLSQVVTAGFLTWAKPRRAVSLLLCPYLPITFLLLPSSLPKSGMAAPWAADLLLLSSAPSFLHTFLASHLPTHFGKCSPDPKEFAG